MQREQADRMLSYVLGRLKPKFVIVTTPNSDFNVIFEDGSTRQRFRHPDHKFELSRKEFMEMVLPFANKFGYFVEVSGIGVPIEWNGFSEEQIGCCTQAAVFRRDELARTSESSSLSSETKHFQLISHHLYPQTVITSLDPNELLSEIACQVRNYCWEYLVRRQRTRDSSINEDCSDEEGVPVNLIYSCCERASERYATINDFVKFLESDVSRNNGLRLSHNRLLVELDESPLSSEADASEVSEISTNFAWNFHTPIVDESETWGDEFDQFSDAD